jgi:hypothetical protein
MRVFLIAILASITVSFAAPAFAFEPVAFHSPSKNIYCYAFVENDISTVECELVTKTNDKPLKPKPSDCDLDWGSRFAVNDAGKSRMVCAGDTLRSDASKVLPYEQRLDYYGIACTATKQGMICINDDAHGFTIAKGKQELY